MIAYLASGPRGERLRLAAFKVEAHPVEDELKVVVQVMEGKKPIVEDPLAVDFMTPLNLVHYISESRRQGWTFDAA